MPMVVSGKGGGKHAPPAKQVWLRGEGVERRGCKTVYEVFLDYSQLHVGSSGVLGWLQLNGSRPAPSHQPRSGRVLDHSPGHASVCSVECQVLYSAAEVGPTLPSLME